MKKKLAILLFLIYILSFGAYASQLTWDVVSNGATINDGAGTWKVGVSTFNDGTGSVVWATGSDAIIGNGGVGGVITVSGTVIPNSILFLPVSSNYTVTGGIIMLSNTGTIITTSGSTSPIINSVLSGTGGLIKMGSGTLTLGGTNTYTGNTTISEGKIIANNNSAFGLTGNIYVSSGAILDISGLNFSGQDNIFSRTTVVTGGNIISSIQTIKYGFESDISGTSPADIFIDYKGSMKVGSITGLSGKGATVSSASGAWPPIVPITLTKFPASTDYSVIWLQSNANTGYKNGVTLRAQPTTSPSVNSGVRQGYLFQISSYTNQLMFAVVSTTGYNITIKNLTGAFPNVPRRYKATVIGDTQTFSYSDISNKGPWIVAIQKTFSNYSSGGYTQYTDGWNYQNLNLAYIDDIIMQYISSTTVAPDRPNTPSLVEIGSTSAIFSFSGSVLSDVTQYTLTANPGAITVTGTGSPLTLSGLFPSTTYEFTLSAQNSAGSSTGSNPYTGTTSATTTATIIYSETGATSGNVTATLTGLSGATITNNSGNDVYTFTGNGSFTFTYTQGASTGSAVAIVSRIDKISPTATINYTTTGATSGNVIATLTGFSESITITNNGGVSGHTFVDNGSFTFNFVDAVGNIGSTTAIVTWINKPMSLTITSPVQYQVIQRDKSTNKGSIQILGTYTGSLSGIEASRNNGGFVNISAVMSGGIFTGILTNQTGGQGTLIIRTTNNTGDITSLFNLGIGDIFVVAGQSNAAGWGANPQLFTGSNGITATLFGNDYIWKTLRDPYDDDTNQIDTVSLDASSNGSFVPLLATKIISSQSIPVAFVPAAMGATNISLWLPGTNHFDRTTLYGSMAYRITQVGGKIAGVLWFQGESDVMMKRSTSSYQTALNTIINTLQSDFSSTGTIKWFIGSIGPDSYSGDDIDAIRKAQQEIYLTNSYVYHTNALTYDINIADEGGGNLHFRSNGELETFSQRWWNAIAKEYYGLGMNTSPRILSTGAVLYTNNNSLVLTFDTPLAEQVPSLYTNNLAGITYLTGSVSAFGISGGNLSVESVILSGSNSVVLSLSGNVSLSSIYLNYANANSGVNKAIYSSLTYQPVYPIYSMPITVVDNSAPIVSLNGSGTIIIAQGSLYTDSGASWVDNFDGSGSILVGSWGTPGSFVVSGSVNTNISGIYYIQYNKVDAVGNSTITIRTVHVTELIAGTIAYSTTGVTNGNVTATLSLNKTGTITNNGGSNSYLFTNNGSFTFNFVDGVGNTGSAIATVTWITTSNGGGVVGLVQDSCPNGDNSSSFYDGICNTNTDQQTNGSIVGSAYSNELYNAYSYAYGIGITTMNTIQKADMEGNLIRAHLAKMMVNYAIKVLGKTLNTGVNCTFTDLVGQTTEMKNYILRSCQLGLMGINMDNKFNPNGGVTRAEFGTMLSRTLYGDIYEGGILYYTKHLDALKAAGIMNNIKTPENIKELRGYVMLMLMRAGE